ncbi:dimethylhistidine N-methyltransferase [Tateyamaria omphalii]|uniref:L-histidine N(alpha)-methyltransferase n=1 Tax=Tateyamaria omphalii TaxID=299262 RepID=UPI0016771D8F|nr:L-histidine N(alpha)-methyltransferase [Tateyamaria omphalii]GGX43082.1 dimethylhistidine N-methyltransferase [Tateyamaria omphalii]
MDGTLGISEVDQKEFDALIADALTGLTAPQKSLSPKWLYDHHGSALFEQITNLPEYYPTRTEAGILRNHAAALSGLVPHDGALVELGSGASIKTRTLLDVGSHFGTYVPIDISRDFLMQTADDLQNRYPALKIAPLVADFSAPVTMPDPLAQIPKVGFFPGSTIGNLTPERAKALLAGVRAWDGITAFIVGMDMVKDTKELVAAYDDAQGVTAKFIKNILVRLNREAGANFDTEAFRYQASWDSELARIDMHLVSAHDQHIRLAGHTIAFQAEEAIHISAARKYTPESVRELAQSTGWDVAIRYTDADARFSVVVLTPCM